MQPKRTGGFQPPTRRGPSADTGAKAQPASPDLASVVDHADQLDYPIEEIQRLLMVSRAQHDDALTEFIENGASAPNRDLRGVAQSERHQIGAPTLELLQAVHAQRDCEPRHAFRVHHARPEAVAHLTTPGSLIADFGVQSASIHLPNAKNWLLEHPNDATEKFIFVLDKDVPKKNVATGFLVDHLLVLPGEVLQVVEAQQRDGTTYVMLRQTGSTADRAVHSPFDGTVYERFAEKQARLASWLT